VCNRRTVLQNWAKKSLVEDGEKMYTEMSETLENVVGLPHGFCCNMVCMKVKLKGRINNNTKIMV
jgi:hypothetical protein